MNTISRLSINPKYINTNFASSLLLGLFPELKEGLEPILIECDSGPYIQIKDLTPLIQVILNQAHQHWWDPEEEKVLALLKDLVK